MFAQKGAFVRPVKLLTTLVRTVKSNPKPTSTSKRKRRGPVSLAHLLGDSFYRRIYESLGDAFCMVNMEGQLVECNPAYQKLTGYPAEELTQLTYHDLTPLKWHAFEEKIVREQILKHGQSAVYEKEYIHKTGRVFPVELRTFLLTDDAGKPAGMWAIVRDLSARKQTEDQLREHQEMLTSIVENSRNWIWTTDAKGVHLYSNRAVEPILGCKVEEIIGSDCLDLIHPEDRHIFKDKFSQWTATKSGWSDVLFRCLHRDGSYRYLESTASPVLGPDGALLGFRGVDRDVTLRIQAEDELRLKEQHLSEAQRIAHLGSWQRDMRTGVLTWSEETYRIFGWDPAIPVTFSGFLQRIHPDDFAQLRAAQYDALDDKKAIDTEYRIIRPDGTIRHIYERSHAAHDQKKQLLKLEGIVLDITERKQAEDELRRLSQQLMRSQDDERRRIARELHDTTAQQLVALKINLNLISKKAHGLDEASRKNLEESLALADRSFNEVRTLSYLLHSPQLDQLGMSGTVKDYVGGFARRTGIRIKLKVAPGVDDMPVECQMTLYRIIQETLANIHRHSGSASASINLSRTDHEARLEVRDRGRGIPAPEKLGGKNPAQSFGVGIPGMRERLRQLNGHLEIKSSPRGTCVTAILPCQKK